MTEASPTFRFAPSPTGLLHAGNARTALINWLFAQELGGDFVLRFDDTDTDRSTAGFADAIDRDLAWLGLTWTRVERQSARLPAYEAALERLKHAGRAYPCFETPEELEFKRRRQRARGLPPVYDRAALSLDADQRSALEAEGRRPHWRFKLDHERTGWTDLVRGSHEIDAASVSDPVVVRADGTFLYMLPSTVDDIDMAVTHVVRGEDHVGNTGVQIQMFRALGAEPPAFGHVPLLVDASGEGLSKRIGSRSLADLREGGIEPLPLAIYLASLGTGAGLDPTSTLADLVAAFDITRFGRATPRFDPDQLERLNAGYLHALPYSAVAERLAALGLDHADDAFWAVVRPNLARLTEAAGWHAVCFGEITPIGDDPTFLVTAMELAPAGPWDGETWGAWTAAIKTATGRKGKALFQPLRLALTGRPNGPALDGLLPLIGREHALARMSRVGVPADQGDTA